MYNKNKLFTTKSYESATFTMLQQKIETKSLFLDLNNVGIVQIIYNHFMLRSYNVKLKTLWQMQWLYD